MLTKEVPTGYARLTLELVRADKELFTVMAQELQLTDKRLTATPAPMDESMKTLRTDPRITMCLLPLAKGAPKTASEDKGATSSKTPPPPKPHSMPKTGAKKKFAATKRAREMCPAESHGPVRTHHMGHSSVVDTTITLLCFQRMCHQDMQS